MNESVSIPSWVWWLIIKLVGGILLSIGTVVVAVFWKTGRLPFSSLGRVEKPPTERRSNDVIVSKLIEALTQGGQKVSQEMHDLTAAMRDQTKAINDGFRDLHRKVESLAKNSGTHIH